MLQSVDAEYKVSEAPLAVSSGALPPQQYLGLFGTDDPDAILEKASRVAATLVKLVDKQGLVVDIKGKKFPKVEAWQTLAAMLSVNAVCEWTRPVESGWEARVVVYNRSGQMIAAAEAQCTTKEFGKNKWEDYAIRSMSATRAASKAYRSNLGYIMVLAGYQATPAEEITPEMLDSKPVEKRQAPPSLVSIRKRALQCGLIPKETLFGAWAREFVPGCKDIPQGKPPTPEQLAEIEVFIADCESQLEAKAA
jgi:hypothetical protein